MGQLVVSNTIMFSNPGGDFGAGVDVTRSIFSGASGDNLDVDPMFVDSANGDYRLLAGSPAIDAGDSRHPMLMGSGAADLGGNARLIDDLAVADTGVADATGVVDIGAFEGGCALLVLDPCPGDINGDGIVDTADLGILIGSFGSMCN